MSELVKVRAYLGDTGDMLGGETFWAAPVPAARAGEDAYEVRNILFFADGINLFDTVRAEERDGLPTVEEVIARSGHRTLRIVFEDAVPEAKIQDTLKDLREAHGIIPERAFRTFFTISVQPASEEHYAALLTRLQALEQDGILYAIEEAWEPAEVEEEEEGRNGG